MCAAAVCGSTTAACLLMYSWHCVLEHEMVYRIVSIIIIFNVCVCFFCAVAPCATFPMWKVESLTRSDCWFMVLDRYGCVSTRNAAHNLHGTEQREREKEKKYRIFAFFTTDFFPLFFGCAFLRWQLVTEHNGSKPFHTEDAIFALHEWKKFFETPSK